MIAISCALGVMLLVLGLRYGRSGFARLADLHLRGSSFAVAAVATQVFAVVSEQRVAWLLVSLVCLSCFCWLNRQRTGMALVFIGVALNLAVMLANGGVMPINAATLATVQGVEVEETRFEGPTKSAVIEDREAALSWLGDRLLLPGPLARLAAWSIGDVILFIGIAGLLSNTMRGSQHVTAEPSHRLA